LGPAGLKAPRSSRRLFFGNPFRSARVEPYLESGWDSAQALAALRHSRRDPGALWIAKECGGARGRHAVVTPSLAAAATLDTAAPAIAQRYVEEPALLRGRKFDVRFLAPSCVASQPIHLGYGVQRVRAFRNEFFLRDFLELESSRPRRAGTNGPRIVGNEVDSTAVEAFF
jgi:hypothetical protein